MLAIRAPASWFDARSAVVRIFGESERAPRRRVASQAREMRGSRPDAAVRGAKIDWQEEVAAQRRPMGAADRAAREPLRRINPLVTKP
jgi:hypothetical protein